MNLKKLIIKCQKNNRKAQSELFYLYRDVLFSISLKYCKNHAEAEDNLQDSFITIFNKINQYKFKGSFEGWIKRITINKAIDKYNKSLFKDFSALNEQIADIEIEPDQLNFSLDKLLRFIQELPDKYRLVFSLYELDNYTHKEIASMLNISQGTSKSNLHRAKIILKARIISENKDLKHKALQND